LEDERKILNDLRKLKPFSVVPRRSHASFPEITQNPLEGFNEEKCDEWLHRHQKTFLYIFQQLIMEIVGMKIFKH
jgi:hypothetical protein